MRVCGNAGLLITSPMVTFNLCRQVRKECTRAITQNEKRCVRATMDFADEVEWARLLCFSIARRPPMQTSLLVHEFCSFMFAIF